MSDDDEPKRERYNTSYLVGQIQTEQKRTRTVGFVVLGILFVALVYFLLIRKPSEPEIPQPSPTSVTAPTPAPVPAVPGNTAVPTTPAAPGATPAPTMPGAPKAAAPAAPAPAFPPAPTAK